MAPAGRTKKLRRSIAKQATRTPTGIAGFDEIAGGGLPHGADATKLRPLPVQRIVGTLSQRQVVLEASGLQQDFTA